MRNKIIHEVKDITKLAIGALMVGGVFKQSFLTHTLLVWVNLVGFSLFLLLLTKLEK